MPFTDWKKFFVCQHHVVFMSRGSRCCSTYRSYSCTFSDMHVLGMECSVKTWKVSLFSVDVVLCRKSLFKLRFPGEILRARRTGMEVTKAFPVLLDLLVTSPGSARLHESQCTQHLPNLFPDCFRSTCLSQTEKVFRTRTLLFIFQLLLMPSFWQACIGNGM